MLSTCLTVLFNAYYGCGYVFSQEGFVPPEEGEEEVQPEAEYNIEEGVQEMTVHDPGYGQEEEEELEEY